MWAIIATLASLVMLSSCGSSDGGTAENLSKAEFIKQADQICSKTEERQLALVNKFEESKSGKESQPSAKAEEELVAFAGLPPVQQQLQELSDLAAPESEAGQINGYLKALETGLSAAEKDPSLMLDLETDPFAKAASLAEDAGFKVCSGA